MHEYKETDASPTNGLNLDAVKGEKGFLQFVTTKEVKEGETLMEVPEDLVLSLDSSDFAEIDNGLFTEVMSDESSVLRKRRAVAEPYLPKFRKTDKSSEIPTCIILSDGVKETLVHHPEDISKSVRRNNPLDDVEQVGDNFFQHEKIFFPIFFPGRSSDIGHWALVVVSFKEEKIIYYDSLFHHTHFRTATQASITTLLFQSITCNISGYTLIHHVFALSNALDINIRLYGPNHLVSLCNGNCWPVRKRPYFNEQFLKQYCIAWSTSAYDSKRKTTKGKTTTTLLRLL